MDDEDSHTENDITCTARVLDSPCNNSEIEFYQNDICLPMFSKGNDTPMRSKVIASLIISDEINKDKIAFAPPVYVEHNVSFMIDSSSLGDHRDLKMDLTAGMTKNKTKFLFFTKDPMDISGLKASGSKWYDYKVTRYIYSHKIHKDFHKVVITVNDTEKLLPLVFIQFYFDEDEHAISITNAGQKRKSFYSVRTNASQLCAAGKKGKQAFHDLSQKVGSFDNARTVADLPSSYQQIYDAYRNKKEDELIEMIDICNRQKSEGNAFIRDMRYAPELSVFLAFDSQLRDIYSMIF